MPETTRPKTLEELVRERVNDTAIDLVGTAFEEIDRIADAAKDELKKLIIRSISAPRKKGNQ